MDAFPAGAIISCTQIVVIHRADFIENADSVQAIIIGTREGVIAGDVKMQALSVYTGINCAGVAVIQCAKRSVGADSVIAEIIRA